MLLPAKLSDRQVGYYFVNCFLLGVVVLSWTYTILAGKFVSENYLERLDLSQFYTYPDPATTGAETRNNWQDEESIT